MKEVRHWRMGGGRSRTDGPGSRGMKVAKVAFAKRMRENPTGPEREVAAMLRRLGIRYRSQVLMFGYIADFYVAEAGLVIEADGPLHRKSQAADATRDMRLRAHDIETLRLTVDQLRLSPARCEADIEAMIAKRKAKWSGKPRPDAIRQRTKRCPHCSTTCATQDRVARHIAKHHPEIAPPARKPALQTSGKLPCPNCAARYDAVLDLELHRRAKHPLI